MGMSDGVSVDMSAMHGGAGSHVAPASASVLALNARRLRFVMDLSRRILTPCAGVRAERGGVPRTESVEARHSAADSNAHDTAWSLLVDHRRRGGRDAAGAALIAALHRRRRGIIRRGACAWCNLDHSACATGP